jgi:RNA polymerase sigma-70 factor (ECF subfamily)
MPEPELLPGLLVRCRDGDRQAIERLVQRFYRYTLSLAHALVQEGPGAEDVVQEAMVTMLTHLNEVRDPQAFPGWLRQIVRTHANRIRRRGHLQLAGFRLSDQVSPPNQAQLDELRHHVRSAIAQLPPAGQQTARLFYLDELDQSQIAHQLEIPLGTVKRRLHDARVKLRKILDPNLPL